MVAVDLYDTLTFADDPSGADHAARATTRALPTGARQPGGQGGRAAQGAESGCRRGARDHAAQGDPRAGGAGRRLERRGGDAGGPGPALGPADPARPARRAGRRRSAATWPSSCTPRRRSAGAGASGWSPWRCPSPCTSCWSARRSALSTADVYRNLTPPERPRPIGPVLEALAARRDRPSLGRSLFNRLQPVAEALRARAGAGPRRPGEPRPVARRVPDEWERLGLFRPVPRPRRGRSTPRDASKRSD